MRKIIFMCCVLALAVTGAAKDAVKKSGVAVLKGKKMTFTVTSPAFKSNGFIPGKYTCAGKDVSPGLKWQGLPEGAQSVVVIVDDPDAASGTWVHWILFEIPATLGGLPEKIARKDVLPDGSRHGLSWGVDEDTFSRMGYYGPCPPPGKTHHYFFKVYALDKFLGLPAGTTKGALLKAMQGHILAQAELVGLYKK